MNYYNSNSCYVLFNPQKVRIIKSFSLRGPAKSVWISKNSNYRGSNLQVFPLEFVWRNFFRISKSSNYADSN